MFDGHDDIALGCCLLIQFSILLVGHGWTNISCSLGVKLWDHMRASRHRLGVVGASLGHSHWFLGQGLRLNQDSFLGA